jgi:hypothetical protein
VSVFDEIEPVAQKAHPACAITARLFLRNPTFRYSNIFAVDNPPTKS